MLLQQNHMLRQTRDFVTQGRSDGYLRSVGKVKEKVKVNNEDLAFIRSQ